MVRRSLSREELRREAARLVLTTDKSAAQVVRDLGISDQMLRAGSPRLRGLARHDDPTRSIHSPMPGPLSPETG
jgi:hypothetical protein